MAKFYGVIGYVTTNETEPGIWSQVVTERKYFGDIFKRSKSWQNNQKVNDDISVNVELSVVADSYLYSHIHNIRFAVYNDTAWEVTTVEPQPPRLILSLGGIYNGRRAEES